MKTKLCRLFALLLFCSSFSVLGQGKIVNGTVSDESGMPLPGVNIIIDGTSTGTNTDFDGNYSISTKVGDVLTFTFLGFKSQSLTVGSSETINVTLFEDAATLDEVVVTAFGIEKEQKSLGYAVSKVDGEALEQQAETDIGRLLRGKAAGVNVTATNGTVGSGTNMIIRGYTSITGGNQPLFIVDGVPFNSGTNRQSDWLDGQNASSRMLDIDPNNIAEVNVLKGLSATTLYGNRGRNGVVIITTKNGALSDNTQTSVDISSSIFFSDAHTPDYQDDFGGGFNQEFGWYFSNWGPAFSDTNPAVYGSFFSSVKDGQVYVTHPFASNNEPAYIAGYEDLAASEYAYKPYNSLENFLRQGVTSNQSVSVRGGNDKAQYSVSYTKVEDKGILPGNSLNKDNFGVGGKVKHGKLTVNGTLNYAKTNYKSPPIAASNGSGVLGGGSSVYADIMYTPRGVDLVNIPHQRADGGSLYYRTGNDIQHPQWTVENAFVSQLTNRVFGSFGANFEINSNLSAFYKYGLDTYTETGINAQNKNGIDGDTTGFLTTTSIVNNQIDHNAGVNFNSAINEDINLSAVVGFNANHNKLTREGVESKNQITFGVLKHWNFVNQSNTSDLFGGLDFESVRNIYGVYADVTLDYKDYLFLNLNARTDWASSLEDGNNNITYPGASISFLPTSAFENITSDYFNYLKLRLGYGSSAGFPGTYSTRSVLALTAREFVDQAGNVLASNTTGNVLGNPNLTPELVSEIEFGIETRLINNRVGINMSLFKRETTDLLTTRPLDPSTGYTSTQINGGDLENKGIELGLDVDWLQQADGFSWSTNLNFYSDDPVITRLPSGVSLLPLPGSGGLQSMIEGQPYGVLTGTKRVYHENGQPIIGADGNYQVSADNDLIIGDPNPDYTSTLTNTFKYKGFTLSVGLNYRKGGDIYSITSATLLNRGLVDFPVSRYGTYALPGVTADGAPNTTQINATNIAFDNWLYGPNEFRVFDGTTIRLNEVSLSYRLSQKVLGKTPFTSVVLTASGSNLWYDAVNFPDPINFDTNTLSTGVGNTSGIDYISGPSARRYGFSLKVTL